MEEKYEIWDKFIHEMLLRLTTAQRQYENFILGELSPDEPYDLFFYRLSFIANTFVNNCHIYGYVSGLFKYLRFKYNERTLKKIPYEVMMKIPCKETHICSREERVQLIEAAMQEHGISPEDISTIYKEYYGKCKSLL